MARGAGPGGGWASGRRDRAELADPGAPVVEALVPQADQVLLVVASLLLDGAVPSTDHAALVSRCAAAGVEKRHLALCCGYLRDRVGVPRDMSYPAARVLRGALNYAIDELA